MVVNEQPQVVGRALYPEQQNHHKLNCLEEQDSQA